MMAMMMTMMMMMTRPVFTRLKNFILPVLFFFNKL